jgi:hypothetical protein
MSPMKVVWLCGMPRSGTNWLCQIFDSHENVNFKLSPLFSYAFKNKVGVNSTKEDWTKFFEDVYHSKDDFLNQTQKRADGIFPDFMVKRSFPEFLVIKDTRYHNLIPSILEHFADIKIVYIVRNPCGAINSWLLSKKEFPSHADPLKEWKTGHCRKIGMEEFWGFDDWKSLTKQYLDLERKYPEKVKVVSYEDIVEQSSLQTSIMFDFVGLNPSKQTEDFLMLSQTTHIEHGNAVYKDKSVKDNWKSSLAPEIIAAIKDDLEGTELEKYLYK